LETEHAENAAKFSRFGLSIKVRGHIDKFMRVSGEDDLVVVEGTVQDKSSTIIPSYDGKGFVTLRGQPNGSIDMMSRSYLQYTLSNPPKPFESRLGYLRSVSSPSGGDRFFIEKVEPRPGDSVELKKLLSSKKETLSILKGQLAELKGTALMAKRREASLADLSTLIREKRSELSILRDGGQGEVRLSMNQIHSTSTGLTVNGALLAFAETKETPRLFDSGSGTLAAY